MVFSNPRRLTVTAVPVIAISIFLLLQAISGVVAKRAPELSLNFMPGNGLALELKAFTAFTSRVVDPEDTGEAAQYAAADAMRALRSSSLAPKAYAILAMAETNQAKRKEILSLANKLNRRDLSLQSLWLKEQLAENDFPTAAETLDRILRVYPQYWDQFFPVLGEALEDKQTIPQFTRILDDGAKWQERFLAYAAAQRELQPNLALLRMQTEIANEAIDQDLIVGLVRQGLYEEAYGLYEHLVMQGQAGGDVKPGSWRSDYPPFDWYFADQTGFRAQQSTDAQSLEIFVRPGKGGVIAERFIKAPDRPFLVRISHRIAPVEQLRDVRLQANCAGSGTPYFDERFMPGEVTFELPSTPEECEFISLVINARAWSGRSSLSGTIDSFELSESTSAGAG